MRVITTPYSVQSEITAKLENSNKPRIEEGRFEVQPVPATAPATAPATLDSAYHGGDWSIVGSIEMNDKTPVSAAKATKAYHQADMLRLQHIDSASILL